MLANGMPKHLPQPSFGTNLGFSAPFTSSVVIEHKRQGEKREDVHTHKAKQRERERERDVRAVGLLGLPLGLFVW